MGSGEKPSASEGRTNLEGKAPICSIDGTLSSANDGAGAATDGRAISFTYQQGGALTDEAVNDGWTDGNVSVAIDGTRLTITIKNIDGAKVLAKGQSYEVTYRTVLDKNAFVAALVKAGGTAANAAYCIQNVASLSSGGAVLSGGSNASFTPSIPVTAEKSAATTPQGGLETQSASFTVKAGASVVVDYTLTVDRAAYVAAGGDLDGVAAFRNAFAVSTADGSTAEDSSTGKVKV